MKDCRSLLVAGLCGVLALCSGATLGADVAGLLNSDPAARNDAVAKFIAEKAQAVPVLLAALDGTNATAAKMAGETLAQLVHKYAGTADGQAVADALAAELKAKHAPATRRQICALLAFGGGGKSVAALDAALGDADLREDARRALVRIVDRQAAEVLARALGKADEAWKIALIDGLGQKHDPAGVSALVEQTAAGVAEPVRRAAWNALAEIPSAEALPVFTKAVGEAKDPLALEESLDFTTTLLNAGMLAQAEKVIKLRIGAGSLSDMDTCKLLRAQARLGTPAAIEFVLTRLDAPNPKIRGAALEASAVLPGTDVSRLITERMVKAKGAERIDLLGVLGRRGGQMDDRTVMMMYMAMLDTDDAVKIACIRAMESAGVTSTVPTLVNFVRGQPGPVANAAEQALARIPGAAVTNELTHALGQASAAGKGRLLRIVGNRRDVAALPAMIRAAGDSDAAVRASAYEAMAGLDSEEIYDTLLAAFEGAAGPDRDAAEKAMASLKSDVITAKLVATYFDVGEAQKPSLLRVLAPRQLEAIDALLRSESVSSDADIRAAAVQGLCKRGNPGAAPTLLAAAKAGPESIAKVAVGGYLQIAQRIEGKDAAGAGQMYAEALKLAVGDEQKCIAARGMGRVSDPNGAGTIDAVVALLKEGKSPVDSAMALAGLAARLPATQKGKAVEWLNLAMKTSSDNAVQKATIRGLRKFGVAIDPAREQGFITCWWMAGPFTRGGNSDWDAFPEELAHVDLSKTVKLDGKDVAWKQVYSPDPQGAVDLIEAFGASNNLAVFGYAEISCAGVGEATFKVGSDDGIAVWVNGEKLHANNAFRGLKTDEDVFKAKLKAGSNAIVVKVLQARDAWSFCMRIVGEDGKPLALKQRTE